MLKHDCLLKNNISKEEPRAFKELKQAKSRIIHRVDNRVAMVELKTGLHQ